MSFLSFNSEISSRALIFARKFRCRSCTNNYLFYDFLNQVGYNSVSIIKTSKNCYRVLSYSCFNKVHKTAEYRSFRSLYDLCVYLDSICPSAVENK